MPLTVRFDSFAHVSSAREYSRAPSFDHSTRCAPVQPPSSSGCELPSATSVCTSAGLSVTSVVSDAALPRAVTHTRARGACCSANTASPPRVVSTLTVQQPSQGAHRASACSCADAGEAMSMAPVSNNE